MAEKVGSVLRPWHSSWWLPDLTKDNRQDSCQRIAEASAPKPSYFVLIILSTLIASYGLVSNSTATVIGAMIVAPLMGPILGLALGTVLGDDRMFRRSLLAESTGAALVILTGMLVAWTVGVSHIDFGASEIAGRTRPTLFDLAIGLAAGLAGAYCTVHPGLQGSVAGVAIAVALVPPLAVTGLTGAGWLSGEVAFEPVFGSFMLFFTNLLTIELASGLIFLGTGFRLVKEGKTKVVFRRALIIKSICLLLTGWFLSVQLTQLLQERYGLSTARAELEKALKDIPGAALDSVRADLQKKQLTVRAVVGSRTDIEPPLVARFEKRLSNAVQAGLPDVQVKLVVRTVNSTYAASTGYLFEPSRKGLDDDERRAQALDLALRELLLKFPGVELVEFHLTPNEHPSISHDATGLTLTLSSPYEFGPRFVRDLENQLQNELESDLLFAGRKYRLLVKTLLIRNATSENSVVVHAPDFGSDEDREFAQRSERLRTLLVSALELNPGVIVTELNLRRTDNTAPPKPKQVDEDPQSAPSPTPVAPELDFPIDSFTAQVKIRSPQLVEEKTLLEARKYAEKIYRQDTGFEIKLNLDASITLGTKLYLEQKTELRPESEEAVSVSTIEPLEQVLVDSLSKLVRKQPGANLVGTPEIKKLPNSQGDYSLKAIISSPKPIENKTAMQWQKELLKAHPELKSLEMQIESRIGRMVTLTRLRQE